MINLGVDKLVKNCLSVADAPLDAAAKLLSGTIQPKHIGILAR